MAERREFLHVVSADEAHRRFRAALDLEPKPPERIPLEEALGRVLASDVVATVDVPSFDRSNVDGFAVRALDTFGADEAHPRRIALTGEVLHPGVAPRIEVADGLATEVATGAVLPRGADAVVMVEHVDELDGAIDVRRAVTPGNAVSFAGSDIARGELVLRAGTRLTARETGTLAALGLATIEVYGRPRIGVLSTGDEIIPVGEPARPGAIHDANLRIIADSLREIGCDPVSLGIVGDDEVLLRERVRAGLALDGLILSGGTSKGGGDLSARVVEELATVVAHGVAVKPGKPLCLAASDGKPVVVLPGFPTSAVFTFREFVAPLLTALTGEPPSPGATVSARLPMRIELDPSREEFVLVHLLEATDRPVDTAGPTHVAYPMGKGSGSITAFSRADGFITLGGQQSFVEANRTVRVRLIGREVRPADLVFIGSHCIGVDLLLSELHRRGFTSKTIIVGSQGGLAAAERGECDLAGVHLADEKGDYNRPFLRGDVELVPGYTRRQGLVHRRGEPRPDLRSSLMVNRNRGSGTRVLIDELLDTEQAGRPPGYANEAKSHNAVAAAVASGRADWGVTIEGIAAMYDLELEPLRDEHYDFVIPRQRRARPVVAAFIELLGDDAIRAALREAVGGGDRLGRREA